MAAIDRTVDQAGAERALAALQGLALERGEKLIAAEAAEAAAALAAGQFHAAFVGQFKRGKSTLINALLGRRLLPADVAPVTSAITIVQHAAQECCIVHFQDGRQQEAAPAALADFVSEDANPGNRLGVGKVVIELPLPLLANGLRLVDTPGVGSIFASNTETTRSFLPRIDVAVVVLGCDPPITGEEIALVRAIAPTVGRFLFVLNKADQTNKEIRAKAEAFTRRALTEALGREPDLVLHLSSLKALQGKADAGAKEFVARLQELAAGSRRALTVGSAGRAVAHLAARLEGQIQLERAALLAPLTELNGKIDRFQASMRDIDDLALAAWTRAKSQLSYDWKEWETAKQEALAKEQEEIRQAIEAACLAAAGDGARPAAPAGGKKPRAAAPSFAAEDLGWFGRWRAKQRARAALRQVIRRTARETAAQRTAACLEQRRGAASEWVAHHYAAQAERVGAEINRLVERIAKAAADAFNAPVEPFAVKPPALDLASIEFDLAPPTLALDANEWAVPLSDFFASRRKVANRSTRRAARIVEDWLRQNVHRMDSVMVDWLDRSAKQLVGSLRERLDGMGQEIINVVDAGRQQHEAGEEAAARRLAELDRQRARLTEIVRQTGAAPA